MKISQATSTQDMTEIQSLRSPTFKDFADDQVLFENNPEEGIRTTKASKKILLHSNDLKLTVNRIKKRHFICQNRNT